jgi:protein SCO1
MQRMALVLLLCAASALVPIQLGAHTEESPKGLVDLSTLGFEEKPGTIVPLDTIFTAEDGKKITLGETITRPTILSFVYYTCANECSLLLTSISSALKNLSWKAGEEPNLVTISIDETDTPVTAGASKRIAIEAIEKPFPSSRWHFLCGSIKSIDDITDAVGLRFVRRGAEFDHPMGIVVVSKEGKIVRYILGTDFLPMDISMSLMEANTGTIQPTIARFLRICFSYDPKSHTFVFNTLQVSAVVIAALAVIFILYLIISGKRRRTKGAH